MMSKKTAVVMTSVHDAPDPGDRTPTHDADEVVLVDEAGRPTGVMDRAAVHGADTPLHLAFSLLLLDHDGSVLLTRRSLAKRTWPGVWTGSCCGHLRPEESPLDAVRRRTSEELGIELAQPSSVLPGFRYRAVDAGGMVENEICPVYVARIEREGTGLSLDPDEVMESAWVRWGDLHEACRRTPFAFSPWLVSQVHEIGPDAPGAPA